jgi:hypothetical protein
MAGFFTTPTDTNYHSGLSVGSIKNGDTQTFVNEKLAAEIESLKAKLNQVQGSTPVSNTDAIENKSGFGTGDSFTPTDSNVLVTTKPTASGIEVSYDLTQALGADTKILSRVIVEGNKNGISTILIDSDKLSSGFFLSPDNFPASLTVDLRKRTTTGDEFLSAKVPLSSTGESLRTTLYSRKFGGTDLNTQTKVNDFLFDRVKTLENNIPKEVLVNNSYKSLQDAFNDLSSEIKKLKEENAALKNLNTNTTSTSTNSTPGRTNTNTTSTNSNSSSTNSSTSSSTASSASTSDTKSSSESGSSSTNSANSVSTSSGSGSTGRDQANSLSL